MSKQQQGRENEKINWQIRGQLSRGLRVQLYASLNNKLWTLLCVNLWNNIHRELQEELQKV